MSNRLQCAFRTIAILVLAAASTACFYRLNTVEGPPEPNAARAFADRYNSLLIAAKYDDMYALMDPVFRETYTPDAIAKTIESLSGYFGPAIETEYKTDELVDWQYPDGTRKIARKVWYRVKTTKADYGRYFLEVAVVKSKDKMYCLSFKILEFPAGPPDELH